MYSQGVFNSSSLSAIRVVSSPSQVTSISSHNLDSTCVSLSLAYTILGAQSYPTLLQPHGLDGSLSVSFVHKISQARILEWVAISFYNILAYITYKHI